MSYKNPNVTEILQNSTGKIAAHFCKSYLNLAKQQFFKTFKKKATLDDAQILRDLYEEEWFDYYVTKPQEVFKNRTIGKPIWNFTIQFRLDVPLAMNAFILYKYAEFKETTFIGQYNPIMQKNGYFEENISDVFTRLNQNANYIESFIIESQLLDEYKKFVTNFKTVLPKYFKRNYVDYSHLAYNGVADNF